MRRETLNQDHVRAALRLEEHRLKAPLDAIDLNDATNEVVAHQVRHIEEGLRRVRRLASTKKFQTWKWQPFALEASDQLNRAA